jgi:hypothetical protein
LLAVGDFAHKTGCNRRSLRLDAVEVTRRGTTMKKAYLLAGAMALSGLGY